jgi:type IV pilus assembly protein PilY1
MNQANVATKPVRLPRFVSRPRALLFAVLLAVPATRADTLDISQIPLMAGGGLPPNVTFLFDTSFGMNSAILPSTAAHLGKHSTKERPYHQNLAVRAAAVNKLAYNPAETYTPPNKVDGTPYPDSSFEAAWRDGFGAMHPNPLTTVDLRTQYRDRGAGGINFFNRSQPGNDGNCVNNGPVNLPLYSNYCSHSYMDEAPRSAYYTWLNKDRAGIRHDVKERWKFYVEDHASNDAWTNNRSITVAGVDVPMGKDTTYTCAKMSSNGRSDLATRIKCKLNDALASGGWTVSLDGYYTVIVEKGSIGDVPDLTPTFSANGTGAKVKLMEHVDGATVSAGVKGCIYQVRRIPSASPTTNVNDYPVLNVADLDPRSTTKDLYPAWCSSIVSSGGTPFECREGGYSMEGLTGYQRVDVDILKTPTSAYNKSWNPHKLVDEGTPTEHFEWPFQGCFEIVEVGSPRDLELTGKTEAEAKKNFANWYSYYGTRINVIKSATAQAFQTMEDSVRVSFGVTGGGTTDRTVANCDNDEGPTRVMTANCRSGVSFRSQNPSVWGLGSKTYRAGLQEKLVDGLKPNLTDVAGFYALERGARPFKDFGNDPTVPPGYRNKKFRSQVLDYLFSINTATLSAVELEQEKSNPKVDDSDAALSEDLAYLRHSLGEAGEYYRLKDVRGPWSLYPGLTLTVGEAKHNGDDNQFAEQRLQACRRSYTVLVTAGYYRRAGTDDLPRYACARNDQDSTPGQSFVNTPPGFTPSGCLGGRTDDYAAISNSTDANLSGARIGALIRSPNPAYQYVYEPRLPFADARHATGTSTSVSLPNNATGDLAVGATTFRVTSSLDHLYLGEKIMFGSSSTKVYRIIDIDLDEGETAKGIVTLDRGLEDAVTRGTAIRRHDYTRYQNTLADVAMAYWKNDLLPGTDYDPANPPGTVVHDYDPTNPATDKQKDDYANNVLVSASDPAFWQHMNTIALHMGDGASIRARDDSGGATPLIKSVGEGEDWLLANDPYWGYRTGHDTSWCNDSHTGDGTGGVEWCDPVAAAGGAEVYYTPQRYLYGNDLLHAAINSFGAYVSVQSPEELTQALNQAIAAVNVTQDATTAGVATNKNVRGRELLYQPHFTSLGWYGRLKAYRFCTGADVSRDSKYDTVSKTQVLRTTHNTRAKCLKEGDLWAVPDWDASERLAQQICGSSNADDCKDTGFVATRRKILFGSSSPGINLAALPWSAPAGGGLTTEQQDAFGSEERFKWFLGDPAMEESLRARVADGRTPLGDIVNSTPLFVGADDFGYANASRLTSEMRAKYRTRKASSDFINRPEVIYVGANDGMLHAFAAQSNVELPPEPGQTYNYDDGKPNSSDAVPGLPTGARNAGKFTEDGGKEYFAYVPPSLGSKLGELADPGYAHSYYVDGAPTARDAWISTAGVYGWRTVVAGSTGAGGRAYYALDVEDPKNPRVIWEKTSSNSGFENLGVAIGQPSIAFIPGASSPKSVVIFGNGYNSALSNSSKASLFIVDLDGSGVTEIQTPETTASVCPDNGLSTPLVADLNKDGVADAAYAGDLCGNLWKFDLSAASPAAPKLLLVAKDETGKRQPITASPEVATVRAKTGGSRVMVYVGTGKFIETGDKSEVQTQTLYSVVDGEHVDASGNPIVIDRGRLMPQTIKAEFVNNYPGVQGEKIRTLTADTPNPAADPLDYKGFYIDLFVEGEAKRGERVVAKPVVWSDRVVFTTIQPGTDECSTAEGTGFLYEVDPYYGGRLAFTVFDVDGNGEFGNSTDLTHGIISGREVGMGGGVATQGSNKYVGNIKGRVVKTANNPKGMVLGRRSWKQIR